MAVKPVPPYHIDWTDTDTEGLVGCWVLDDEDNGDTFLNLVDGVRATREGGLSVVNTPDGVGIDFPAGENSDRINIGLVDENNPINCARNNQLTAVIRATVREGTNSNPRFFDKSDGGGGANGFLFGLEMPSGAQPENQTYQMQIDTMELLNSAAYAPIGSQATCGFGFTGTSLELFLNGSATDVLAQTNTLVNTPTNAAIGNWNHTSGRNFNGTMDVLMLWDVYKDEAFHTRMHNDPYKFIIEGGGIKIGTADVSAIMAGDTAVDKVMIGENQIWP